MDKCHFLNPCEGNPFLPTIYSMVFAVTQVVFPEAPPRLPKPLYQQS
jgi:hypothetical protein